jgi:hypothetical protein
MEHRILGDDMMSIHDFCEKFCAPYNISDLIYMEIFYNGDVIILTNNGGFYNSYRANLYSFSGGLCNLIKNTPMNEDHFFLWPVNIQEPLPQLLDALHICNGITLYEKTSDSVKTIAFAVDPTNADICNFYINNTDLLKK